VVGEQDRERVGLLAARGAGDPDADRFAVVPREEARDHVALEADEGVRIAEEARDADEEVLQERVGLARIDLEQLRVLLRAADAARRDATLDAPRDGGLLVGREVAP